MQKVRQELLSIKNDLVTINGLSSAHFTYQFLQRHTDVYDKTVQYISIHQEKGLSDVQKNALRMAREKELQCLEKQIQDVQLLLALHVNQLLCNVKKMENICVKMTPVVDAAIDCWNKYVGTPTDVIAVQAYKSILLQNFLLTNVCNAYDELIAVARYYQDCKNECIRCSSTILEVLKNITPTVLKKRHVVFQAKKSHYNDSVTVERYLADRAISIVLLKNQVKQELEQQQRNCEAENLENAERVFSVGGFPDGPKKDDEENEEAQKEYVKIQIYEKNASHIFRNSRGHLSEDTSANRQILLQVASDARNFLGKCKNGNEWYAKILNNGKQIWVSVRNGFIRNGGINDFPYNFTYETGLSC